MHRVGQPGEEASDGADDGAERAAGRHLPELTRSEPKHMPVDYDVAQVLVATSSARGRNAAVDHPSIHVTSLGCPGVNRPLVRLQLAPATSPQRQVIRI